MSQGSLLKKLMPILAMVSLLAAMLACGEMTTAVQPTDKSQVTEETEAAGKPTLVEELSLTSTPTITKTSEPLQAPTDMLRPQPLYLGDILEQKGYLLCALAVEDPATKPGILYEAEAGKKLVAVEFIVGNVSGERINSNVLYATLVDSEGFAYGADSGAIEDSIDYLLDLYPGEKVKGWAGFIVPEDSTPAILKYEMGGEAAQELQVGLKKPDEAIQEPKFVYAPDPNLPTLGEVTEDSGYSLSVLTIEDPATRPGYSYEAQLGERLVAVEFIVGNVSGDQISSNVLYASLVTSEGFLYGAKSGVVEDSIKLLHVNPGEKVRGWAGFIIPEDSIPVSFRYKMGGWFTQMLQVRLTPK